MFRVLSEEEAKKVVRWKAPEISTQAGTLAATRQTVLPTRTSDRSAPRDTQGGNQDETRADAKPRAAVPKKPEQHTSAPALQSVFSASATTSVPLPNPSAEMLQSTYEEGFEAGRVEGHKAGLAEGRQSGKEEGHAIGYAEGNAAIMQQGIAQLHQLIAALDKDRMQSDDTELVDELVSMSMEIARQVIHVELTTNSQAVAGLVTAGLEQLVPTESTARRARMHPLDARIARDILDDQERLEIVEDASLIQGDCVIESGASTVRSGVEDWLTVAAEQLGLAHVGDAKARQ